MTNSDKSKSNEPEAVTPNDHSSEATSKKTLKDIEESEKDSGSASDDHGSPPAPDGQFDESSELGNAGPT